MGRAGHGRAMQRIAIVGCSGGGKSTLALAVGARLGLPVIHLDNLYWKPGWTGSDIEDMRPKVEAEAARERWVIEGNFTGASRLRFERADTIIWIELPTWLCLWRAFARMLLAFGAVRPDLAPGCPERFDLAFYRYIVSWNRLTRPKLARAIAGSAPGARLIRLASDRDKAAFLESLAGPKGGADATNFA
jgi:adenylate kinase family enzyme